MRSHIHLAAATVAAVLLAFALRPAGPAITADRHSVLLPGSRTYLCYVDGHLATGQIRPANPACQRALAFGGSEPFYDWFGVLRADGAGRTRGFVPDGVLCSAGFMKFAGFDTPDSEWPVTHLTAGAIPRPSYGNRVSDAASLRLFITRDGYHPSAPLTWADMEPEPLPSMRMPTGKTGRHVIYSVWQRPGSQETFYSCADVVFDGGAGHVTGLRGDATSSTSLANGLGQHALGVELLSVNRTKGFQNLVGGTGFDRFRDEGVTLSGKDFGMQVSHEVRAGSHDRISTLNAG